MLDTGGCLLIDGLSVLPYTHDQEKHLMFAQVRLPQIVQGQFLSNNSGYGTRYWTAFIDYSRVPDEDFEKALWDDPGADYYIGQVVGEFLVKQGALVLFQLYIAGKPCRVYPADDDLVKQYIRERHNPLEDVDLEALAATEKSA